MSRLAMVSAPAGRTRMRGRIRYFEPPLRAVPSGPSYTEFVTHDGRRVFVHRDVLADLAQLEWAEHPNESAGLLFGRVFTDGVSQCALVRHLIRPEPGEVEGTPVTVTITAEGSSRMSQRALERHPCADAVGWAHTHPTFNAYFSGTDRTEQAIWTAPASVGLVISGLPDANPRFEVFVGPESTPARVADPYGHCIQRPLPTVPPPPREGAEPVPAAGRLTPSAPPSPDVSLPAPRPERRFGSRRSRRAVVRALPSIAVAVLVVVLTWLAGSQLGDGGSDAESSGSAPSTLIDRIARESGVPPSVGGLNQELTELLERVAASMAGSPG